MVAVFDSIGFAVKDVAENFPALSGHFLSSLILIVVIFLGRHLLIRAIRQSKSSTIETKRKWIVHVKNTGLIFLLLGLAVIWGSELRSFALSLVAIAAALAIATKEVILCFMGGIYKASTGPFEIGDRIQIQDLHGDVLDHDLLSTTLHEIGPIPELHQFTGKTITLPNSLFLSHPLVNESKAAYSIHTFRIPIKNDAHWKEKAEGLLHLCQEETQEYLEQARRYMARREFREGLERPSVEPRVSLVLPDAEEIHLVARITVPDLRKGKLEQKILQRFLAENHAERSDF